MSRLPKIAVVGRPNVGKSALFNRICGQRIAIVDEAEGITRDRLYIEADFFGQRFELIDTGGIDAHSKALFNAEVKRQAEIAIEEADSLIMVVDSQVGFTKLDQEVARVLLRTKKPVCLAVNKVDNFSQEFLVHQFHHLGIKKMIGVSAIQGLQIAELLQAALEELEVPTDACSNDTTKIAFIGRPNVGKSTLVNYLIHDNRCIVSPIAGTTRDSIDIAFSLNDHHYTLIDTAGIRRKHAEHEVVDKFAAIRTDRAIARADVCVLILDAVEGLTTQEKRIVNTIEEMGKACVLLFNKWDLVKGFRMEHCLQSIRDNAPFLDYCPVVFGSAQTGRNMDKLFLEIERVREESVKRVTTPQLNKFLEAAFQKTHPPMIRGKRLRIYYMTQIGTQPPTFLLFLNYPELLTEAYKKYLLNQFRLTFGFEGNPVVFQLKGRPKKEVEERKAVEITVPPEEWQEDLPD